MKNTSPILGRASAILPIATAAILAVLGATTATHAQTDTTWTRGNSTTNWSEAANWSAGVPVAGFNAIFGANVGGDPNQFYTLAADRITFASGNTAGHTLQFNIWNVNTAGTFIEVQATNSGAQQINVSRGIAERGITLKAGTNTILNNGSGGLTLGSSVNTSTGSLRSALNANSTLTVDGTGTTTIGPISTGAFAIADNGTGVLSLTKSGSGILNLSGNNTFTGGLTTGGNGSVNLLHSNAVGTGTIFLKSTATTAVTTLGLSGGITVANAIQKDSTTAREGIVSTGTGNNSLTGGITITGAGGNAIFFSNGQTSGNLTVSGGISGALFTSLISLRGSQAGNVGFLNGAVTLASNAFFDNNGITSWTLNTAGSTWGQTLVRSTGNLILGANSALATGAFVNFDSATSTGVIDLNGFNQSVAGLTSVTPTTGNGGRITNNGTADSTLTLAGLTANRTYNGTITDGATKNTSLVMNSASRTQTLNGANTYSGSTTITAGTLALGNNLALQNSAIDTSGAGTVSLASGITTPTLGGLSGSKNLSSVITGNYSLVTALTLNPGTGQSNTYSGNITNGASGMTLTKSGNGTQILAGTNTYSGATNVTGGTLLANNTSGSATGSGNVTVSSGATLGGSGTIGGATTIAGTLSPGNGGIGTLNITGNTTWLGASSAGSSTDWIFQLGASSTADLLNITGNFLKDASIGTNFRFDFGGSAHSGTFVLVTWSGSTGFSASDFSFTNLDGGLTGSFAVNGSQLEFSAIPEPSTWVGMAALALTAGAMVARRRSFQNPLKPFSRG